MALFDSVEIDLKEKLDPSIAESKPLSIALGMFDGIHLGHQSVIGSARKEAEVSGGCSGVLTFDPHPSKVLRPEKATPLIYPRFLKRKLIFDEGIDLIIWKDFSMEFAAVKAEDFLPELLSRFPNLKSIHVGANFRFGNKRLGDVSLLESMGKDIGVDIYRCERVSRNSEWISSTALRGMISEGKISLAAELFGKPYFCMGHQMKGKGLGSKIGFSTLNIPWEPELTPRFGVYVVKGKKAGGDDYFYGIANYGVRPTVEETDRPVLETHVLAGPTEFSKDNEMIIEWLDFIRPEKKFSGIEALTDQIKKDVAFARKYFNLQ